MELIEVVHYQQFILQILKCGNGQKYRLNKPNKHIKRLKKGATNMIKSTFIPVFMGERWEKAAYIATLSYSIGRGGLLNSLPVIIK